MSVNRIFAGFSTGKPRTVGPRSWRLYDIELIKQDLLNSFYTRPGERIMRPTYGCSIWNALMEPMSEVLREEIIAEANRIVNLDPRVKCQSVKVNSSSNAISIVISLLYIPLNIVDQMIVDFNARQ